MKDLGQAADILQDFETLYGIQRLFPSGVCLGALPTKIIETLFHGVPFHQVTRYHEPRALIRDMEDSPFDVVVFYEDDNPKMAPIDFLKLANKLERPGKTFFLLFCNGAKIENLAELQTAGLTGVIQKPYSSEGIRKVLEEFCGLPTRSKLEEYRQRHY